MTTNGVIYADELSLEESLGVLHEKRTAVLRERRLLEINHRIQRKFGRMDIVETIENDLRLCELALEELDAIAQEWKHAGEREGGV